MLIFAEKGSDAFMKAVGKSVDTGKPIDYKSASDKRKAGAAGKQAAALAKSIAQNKKKKEADDNTLYTPAEKPNFELHGISSASVQK